MTKEKPGLNPQIIRKISKIKKEPQWALDFRLKAYQQFLRLKLPKWGPDLSQIDFAKTKYYSNPLEEKARSWEELPPEIKKTYDELGLPEAEQEILAGVSTQWDSEVVYDSIRKSLKAQGVFFSNIEDGLKHKPEIFKKHFGKLIPASDNKLAALNSAVWSGGSFIYIPKGVKVEMPLQAFFLINTPKSGQFERTLIIADEDSYIHYIEGCSAPIYAESSLHAGVVEVYVAKGARVRYTTVQNWSKNIYNLTTKRALVEENGLMEWVDCNIGSKITMKYPACILKGKKARGEMLSISMAGQGQIQDTGGKMIHLAPQTSSRILSKSISKQGGIANYRGLVQIAPQAKDSSSYSSCDSLILDENSQAQAFPKIETEGFRQKVEHEAKVAKIDEDKIAYLMSRGLKQSEAESLLVNGFVEPIIKEVPLEYAVEMNRLIEMEIGK